MSRRPATVLVLGGGVAGLETVLALRADGPADLDITLVSRSARFHEWPATPAERFGTGPAGHVELRELARELDVSLHRDGVTRVDPRRREVRLVSGERLSYEHVVIATGARRRTGVENAVTFPGHAGIINLLEDIDTGAAERVTFAQPRGATWPLALIDLALQSAERAETAGQKPVLLFVTPEDGPLARFGPGVADGVRELLVGAGVEIIGRCTPERVEHGTLHSAERPPLEAGTVISVPALEGPALEGVPCDEDGFVAVDALGAVKGMERMWAAGDVTAFPVKHGGLAAQEADVVAAGILAAVGAGPPPAPLHPVLQGVVLGGLVGFGLEADLEVTVPPRWEAAEPDTPRLFARHLTPWLASRRSRTV